MPLLTAFVLTYGLVAEPSSVVSHMQTLTNVMPQRSAGIIGEQLKSMTESAGTKTGFALLIALLIALYGASKGADLGDDRAQHGLWHQKRPAASSSAP